MCCRQGLFVIRGPVLKYSNLMVLVLAAAPSVSNDYNSPCIFFHRLLTRVFLLSRGRLYDMYAIIEGILTPTPDVEG